MEQHHVHRKYFPHKGKAEGMMTKERVNFITTIKALVRKCPYRGTTAELRDGGRTASGTYGMKDREV